MLQQYNPKNADVMVYVDGKLLHRNDAKVSVFDSVVQGGDAVWEGLRIYKDGIFLKNGPFRPYKERITQQFIRDILDGYFPSELEKEYSKGIHLQGM